MQLRKRLRARFQRQDDAPTPMLRFAISYDDEGANFITSSEDFALLKQGEGQWDTQEQFLVLQMLAEQGDATTLPNGFAILADDVARLADEEAEILGLPPKFEGGFVADVRRNTTSRDFEIKVRAKLGEDRVPWQRKGPHLTVGPQIFRLSVPALRALVAVEDHSRLTYDERTEPCNVRLVAELQAANAMAKDGPEGVRDESFNIRLRPFETLQTVVPDKVGLALEQRPDGSVIVTPDLGPGVDLDALNKRWHHLEGATSGGVVRVEDRLVLLDDKRHAGAMNVLANPHIPARQVPLLVEAPGAFFDEELVDVEFNFGIRVKGVGLVQQTFEEASSSGISWFEEGDAPLPTETLAHLAKDLTAHQEIERKVEQAQKAGSVLIAVDGNLVDVSDEHEVAAALETSRERLSSATVVSQGENGRPGSVGVILQESPSAGAQQRLNADAAAPPHAVDFASLARQPYSHQREGIEWLTGLMSASLEGRDSSPHRVQGAILADDMGLGKTYMTLVALREFMELEQAKGREVRPTLAVLPVSLIENWEEELSKTFHENPYDDVVVLQGNRDLPRFRLRGAHRETVASPSGLDEEGMLADDAIRLSLRVGENYEGARLDVPGRLVLTTYDALRSYQLSLAQVDWGVVVFDEAQHTKNPEALVTRAAKGLKADFKLLATGTPIENRLQDFWSLMDTAQPGLLGTWREFKTEWVAQIDDAELDQKIQLGRELRELVGPFMLRRVKEDHLSELPSKTIYSAVQDAENAVWERALGLQMPEDQRRIYDGHLETFRKRIKPGPGAALETVQALRSISLHPKARGPAPIGVDVPALGESGRMLAMLTVLDTVRQRDEKAIVFVINKKVQRSLVRWLRDRYGIAVSVVNGDTSAVSKGAGATRRTIIRNFEAKPGFNIIVMSPLAVGVGLTVVGANHAIHLERHWNPAKEAQATDRIYRIGQTRPVHVYLPMALHPKFDSFDVNLDRLLRQKTDLKDVIMVPESVEDNEMAASLGLLD